MPLPWCETTSWHLLSAHLVAVRFFMHFASLLARACCKEPCLMSKGAPGLLGESTPKFALISTSTPVSQESHNSSMCCVKALQPFFSLNLEVSLTSYFLIKAFIGAAQMSQLYLALGPIITSASGLIVFSIHFTCTESWKASHLSTTGLCVARPLSNVLHVLF